MKSIKTYGPSLTLAATALVVMLLGPSVVQQIVWAQSDAQIRSTQRSLDQNPSLRDLSDSFRKVAQVVEPSVVHVEVFKRRSADERMSLRGRRDRLRDFFERLPQGDPRRDLFEDWLEESPNGQGGDQPEDESLERYDVPQRTGNGSGWVYDKQHVVTNHHVVNEADRIVLRFSDGSEREAQVVGQDPKTDIALLKVEGSPLHPALLAKERVEKGDIVFAFGSPLRFDFTMSQGIVSAKGRQLNIVARGQGYENFIQTDAAINPGNSGGPLVNIYGQVVGMNTAIATRGRLNPSFMGIGFAIPVKMVQKVVDELLEHGQVRRGYLGIAFKPLDEEILKSYGLDSGVLVQLVQRGGPAHQGGLKLGDIITELNGEPIESGDAFRNAIANLSPGEKVELTVLRQDETKQLTITLGEQPEDMTASLRGEAAPDQTQRDAGPEEVPEEDMQTLRKLGILSVRPFTKELAEQQGVPYAPGVLVRDVRMGSIAFSQGIRQGTVLTHVMGRPVSSVKQLTEQMNKRDLSQGVRVRTVTFQNNRMVPDVVLLKLPAD
jgi:serine protease Do